MNFSRDLRIGYVPFSPTLEFPGDRRRFCYYAKEKDLAFEIARPSQTYDVLVLTQAADITWWSRYPRGRSRIIFDFPDSYLSIPKFDGKGMFRGLAKFVSGQNRRLRLNYWSALQDMCRRADAVVCCTLEQQARILPFCPNVHIILDAHFMVVRSVKDNYAADSVLHFVWEGLAHNLEHLLEIRPALQELHRSRPFLIHAVTELEYGKFLGRKFGRRNTVNEARRIWPGMRLYTWNERTFSSIVNCCDLALVPLPLDDPFCAEKPENRLLLFWRAGMPVLASGTAAHKRVMRECDLDMAPATIQEWRQALEYFSGDEAARKHAGEVGRAYAETRYSEEKMLASWDEVFSSVFEQRAQRSEDAQPNMEKCETSDSFDSLATSGRSGKSKRN